MAAQDGLTFEGTFNDATTGEFKTNTTQAITSLKLRKLPTAIRESYLNRIDDVLDEDDMASNSAAAVPTQQSVKAYVDAQVASGGTSIPFGATSGTNTYSATMSPVVSAYADGQMYHIRVGNSSTGLVTIDLGPGAKKAFDTSGAQIQDGYLKADVDYVIVYNSTLDAAAGGFTVVNEVIHGFMNLRATYTTGTGLWPSTGGSGPSSGIRHGDTFIAGSNMTLGAKVVNTGDFITTMVDAPGQTDASWYVIPGPASLALKAPLASPTFTGTPAAPTAAAGTNTTQVATTAFVQQELTNNLGERVIGQILSPSIYGSGSSIPLTTVVGGLTLTLGTEVFTIAAGSNGTTFVNYVQFNAVVTSLSKYKIYSQVTTGAADANSRGYYIGLVDVQAGSGNDMVFHFDSSSGANGGLALIYHNGTLIAQSPTAMTTFASAALLYEVIRDKDTYTFTVLGPSNEKVVATYSFDLATGTVIKPGCSKFILGSLSTQNRNVYNFRVESDEIVYSDVLYVGDSITNGYYAGTEADSFPRLMEATGRSVAVSASNGAQTIDVFLWTADFPLVKPRKAVLMIGTNDAIAAVAQFTFGVRHWNLYNALKATGADVWVVNLPPISTTDVTAYNTTLAQRYGQTGRLIDVFALLNNGGTDWNATYGSNSHPNTAGHLLIHQTILAALFP